MRRTMAFAAAASLAASVALLPRATSAQPGLVSADPPPGARLGQPPPQVTLCFDEPLARASLSQYQASVRDALGTPLPVTIAFSQDGTCLVLVPQWPEGARGPYSVFYQVRSQATGLPATGTVDFQVGVAASRPDLFRYPAVTAAAAAGAAVLGLLLAAVRRLVGYEPHRPRREAEASSRSHH